MREQLRANPSQKLPRQKWTSFDASWAPPWAQGCLKQSGQQGRGPRPAEQRPTASLLWDSDPTLKKGMDPWAEAQTLTQYNLLELSLSLSLPLHLCLHIHDYFNKYLRAQTGNQPGTRHHRRNLVFQQENNIPDSDLDLETKPMHPWPNDLWNESNTNVHQLMHR